jgi:hypothetical protein
LLSHYFNQQQQVFFLETNKKTTRFDRQVLKGEFQKIAVPYLHSRNQVCFKNLVFCIILGQGDSGKIIYPHINQFLKKTWFNE